METTAFGTIPLEDGQATLPVGPGIVRPAGLDVLATVQDRETMAALSEFLDRLPRHIETAREHFLDNYDRVAADVPAWLYENEPGIFAAMFPAAPDAATVDAEALWLALDVNSIWTRDETAVVLDLGFRDTAMPHAFAAEFRLDGTLTRMGLAS
ncbi:hypothetical protein BV509_19710 [Rhodovulum sulfidophilum]|uniref:Uncharacterized protein n=1 Tax=Rhodovulum visakhapatnamense TaxID=364297 RepID=A0ABS1RCH0_9RHOB|nr:hypothetical protein [Rhodovulum visakhapatnamense]MBL3567908.1 hypothetical protein [Rhodovulum visakhapatnamense]MBL3577346.1 hypothetical protein [Rhodovulum visakhapatnamense]OLS46357.1 hypothetical protein BV509_19710 [Rhodovulum sulfidophilum]